MACTALLGALAALAALAATFGVIPAASAQHRSIALDRLRPGEISDDGFALRSARPLRHLEPSVGLALVYGNDPLVFETVQGDPDSAARIVSHQLTGHLSLGLGFYERVTMVADLPVNLFMLGDDAAARRLGVAGGEDTGVGDLYLAGRVRLTEGGPVTLALSLGLTFPTAQAQLDDQTWAGEATVSGRPELLLDVRSGAFFAMLNLGAAIRGDTEVEGLLLGSELTYGVGLGATMLSGQLDIHAELLGATVMDDVGARETSPLEALGGFRYTTTGGLSLAAAVGPGLRPGLGAPDVRALLSLSWSSHTPDPELDELRRQLEEDRRRRPPVDVGPSDAPGDEGPDAGPDDVGEDSDNDGVTGPRDLCPDEAEDYDMFEDDDGCEDPDNDGDAIPDLDDLCPQDPEDFDIFEDDDGCPDPDNDDDGIEDIDDLCPVEPGPPENDGCPPSGSW